MNLICKNNKIKKVYNGGKIIIISSFFVLLSGGLLLTYKHTGIRYLIIIVGLLISLLLIKKIYNYLLSIIRMYKKKPIDSIDK